MPAPCQHGGGGEPHKLARIEDPQWAPPALSFRIERKVIPSGSGYKQTVGGRRRRLQDAMNAELTAAGWVQAASGWTRSGHG